MRSTSEEGMGRGGTGEEGPSKGELDGCIIHRVHTSLIERNFKHSHLENDPITKCFNFCPQDKFMFPKINTF
jgi:hypothetical protein